MVLYYDLKLKNINMDTKTKIQTVISLVLVLLITLVAYWAQTPSGDLKAQLITNTTETVLVRIQDFAYDPDVVRIEPDTTVSWVNDESAGNADVQHTVTSYDPEDAGAAAVLFDSDLLSLGQTFSYAFDVPGVYYYNCSLHPFMTGKVCVGDESEALDADCATALTEATTTGEETLGTDEENILPDLETVATDTTTAADQALAAQAAADAEALASAELAAAAAADAELFEAADESMEAGVVNTDGDTMTVFFPPEEDATLASTNISDSKLSESGPEHLIYLIPLMIAFFGAAKFAGRKA